MLFADSTRVSLYFDILSLYEIRLYDFDFLIIISLLRHIDTHYKSSFSDLRVLGIMVMSLFFDSSSSAITLDKHLTNSWSMESSSMILTSCLLFLF